MGCGLEAAAFEVDAYPIELDEEDRRRVGARLGSSLDDDPPSSPPTPSSCVLLGGGVLGDIDLDILGPIFLFRELVEDEGPVSGSLSSVRPDPSYSNTGVYSSSSSTWAISCLEAFLLFAGGDSNVKGELDVKEVARGLFIRLAFPLGPNPFNGPTPSPNKLGLLSLRRSG